MRALIERVALAITPEALVSRLGTGPGLVLLRSLGQGSPQARYSFVTAFPFLTFRCGSGRCELTWADRTELRFGDPWRLLDDLLARFELNDEVDMPFPLGGCFGYWGYDLKNFVEPRLSRRALDDLEFPECQLGFYDSLVAFDHHTGGIWAIGTGLEPDGARSAGTARRQVDFWQSRLTASGPEPGDHGPFGGQLAGSPSLFNEPATRQSSQTTVPEPIANSTMDPQQFFDRVARAQQYIAAGDIYQVNLSHRLSAPFNGSGWDLFRALAEVSPSPFSAYMDSGDFQIASSSPELFLRLSGTQVRTRPIKGTRPRSQEPTADAQLSYQLQTSPKEMAELVMITDLLRNDLGKVCEFGSVQVPELARLERYAQVQHLVSTVEGSLRPGVTHLSALKARFPGGSITGAPKVRAMEIIDELEDVRRGPYTGALGYLGFNRESQLSIIIRTALLKEGLAHFQVGAGIVADSVPEAEYLETVAKGRGFIEALRFYQQSYDRFYQR
jgi:para-aminobenzoate synthetase component I